jgi:hypothetical protein
VSPVVVLCTYLAGNIMGAVLMVVFFGKLWLKRLEAASEKIAVNRKMLDTTWKEIKEELEWRSV